MESKGRALKVKKMTAREWKARDPQGYAEANGHSWPPFPSYRPLPACIRWGSGPDRCLEGLDHLGPCRDASGATTLTLAAEILGEGK